MFFSFTRSGHNDSMELTIAGFKTAGILFIAAIFGAIVLVVFNEGVREWWNSQDKGVLAILFVGFCAGILFCGFSFYIGAFSQLSHINEVKFSAELKMAKQKAQEQAALAEHHRNERLKERAKWIALTTLLALAAILGTVGVHFLPR